MQHQALFSLKDKIKKINKIVVSCNFAWLLKGKGFWKRLSNKAQGWGIN